ncbi:hypothetical protein ACWCXM_44240, partial [Streptomyces sp. 900105755]
VRALLAPPPRRALPLVAGAALPALSCASLAEATSDSERMIEDARFAAYVTTLKDTAMPAPPPRRALPLVAGAALPALSCASLAEATSDSERMIDGARFAACVTTLKDTAMPAPPPAHGPCGHPPHDHDEPGPDPRRPRRGPPPACARAFRGAARSRPAGPHAR